VSRRRASWSSCALDCDAAQGYFFARPREAEAIEPLLGRRFVG
jgi:EAL domain-containing protein (putative c-di-GMP-specific phosphodiesterase class I)